MSHSLRVRAAALFGAIALLSSASACSGGAGGTSSSNHHSDTLTLAAQMDNNSFDVAKLQEGNRIQYWQPVFDTLLHTTPKNKLKPGLATKWSYNDNKTILTLSLRKHISFTDGRAFNGDAVKSNLDYIRKGSGQSASDLSSVKAIEAKSSTKVAIHLREPDPALLYMLAYNSGAMASPKTLGKRSSDTKPTGSGPYTFDAKHSTSGSKYKYVRNDDYWDKKSYPYDKITIRSMNDVTPRLNALKTNQINGALLNSQTAQEAETSDVALHKLAVNWVGLNIADRAGKLVPKLKDKRVRQALNYAVNSKALVEKVINGNGTTTSQSFAPYTDAYKKSLDNAYPYDPKKARKLIHRAGASGITLKMPKSNGPYEAMYPLLKSELKDVGIKLDYKQVPLDDAITEARSGKYPVFFTPLGSKQSWRDIETWYTPKAPWNVRHTKDPKLKALIKKARRVSADTRADLYKRINQYVVDQAWNAPYFRPDNIYGTTKDVSVTMQRGNAVPFISAFKPKNN